MGFVEIRGRGTLLTRRQRWGNYLALIFGVAAFFIGANLRDSKLFATTLYTNNRAGISANYPENWLIDSDGDYIFRVRDASTIGFKTTFQVAVSPIGVDTTTRNLFDTLNLQRSQLAAYDVLASNFPYPLPNEQEGTAMTYTYVETTANPFLESVPVVVEGLDVLTISRGQAIVITFLADARSYERDAALFERFVQSLEF